MANLEKRFADDEIIAALRFTGGDIYGAAAKLGCSAVTIFKRKRMVPRIAEAVLQIRGETRYNLVLVAFEQAIAKANGGDTADLYKLINRLDVQLNEDRLADTTLPQTVVHEHHITVSIDERRTELLGILAALRERVGDRSDPGTTNGEAGPAHTESNNGHSH